MQRKPALIPRTIREIKGRYFSVKNEGHEVYCEDCSTWGAIDSPELRTKALSKLTLVREAMPKGDWTITIEQQLRVGGYDVYNPETGEVLS